MSLRWLCCVFLVFGGASAQSVSVVAAGDIACDPEMAGTTRPDLCQSEATAALIERLRPDAVLALGDVQYERGERAAFEAVFNKTWGRFKERIYPSAGNHDYYSGGEGYFDYFGSRAGETDRGYYSFDVGAWHVVALNSNCSIVACHAGSAQELWLRQDLAESAALCTLAFWHAPRYSSGAHGSNSELSDLWQALDEGGVELALSGHDHHYERFAPQDAFGRDAREGVRQFVVGTGGRSLRNTLIPRQQSERRLADAFGVLGLELSQSSYTWAFVSVDDSVLDEGSADCH